MRTRFESANALVTAMNSRILVIFRHKTKYVKRRLRLFLKKVILLSIYGTLLIL